MNAITIKQSVEQICAFRDAAIAQYASAFETIETADAALKEANKLWEAASPGKPGVYAGTASEAEHFFKAVALPDKEQYMRTARRLIDVSVWSRIIEDFGIEQLMDAQEKEKLRNQMRYVPERIDHTGQVINQAEIDKMLPPATPENVYSTLEKLQAEAELIFRRGIVNVFTKLDRRFRSHDGFKIGSRLILNRIVSTEGYFSPYNNRSCDLMRDVERTFRVLDRLPPLAAYASIISTIERERERWTAHQSEHENEYFRIRIYKNGNAHLWFERKDLVEKINKILAEHYGEVIGDGMTKEEDPFDNIKTTPAKNYGFYPTPEKASNTVIEKARLLRSATDERLRILEPSAGTGNLARPCVLFGSEWKDRHKEGYRFDQIVDCIEMQPHLADALTKEKIYHRVTCADFLQVKPDPANLYDRVIMNPPFDRERDIDHVMHAMNFLKPDGLLIAIMSAGTEFRETKKSIAFREYMEKLNAHWEDLPPGSFAEAGTYINTMILSVKRNGSHSRY
jgi:Domain of unknown function (DUF4942)